MKVSQVAKTLGIDERTLRLWIDRPELSPHFSERARREGLGRDLNDDDLIVANTIRTLRGDVGNRNVDWQHIGDELAGNNRNRDLPPTANTIDSGLSVIAQQERMATVVEQRDQALKQLNQSQVEAEKLRSEIADLHDSRRADAERLLRELAAEQQKTARLQSLVELYETGQLKPRKSTG